MRRANRFGGVEAIALAVIEAHRSGAGGDLPMSYELARAVCAFAEDLRDACEEALDHHEYSRREADRIARAIATATRVPVSTPPSPDANRPASH